MHIACYFKYLLSFVWSLYIYFHELRHILCLAGQWAHASTFVLWKKNIYFHFLLRKCFFLRVAKKEHKASWCSNRNKVTFQTSGNINLHKMLLRLKPGILIVIISTSLFEIAHSCARRRRTYRSYRSYRNSRRYSKCNDYHSKFSIPAFILCVFYWMYDQVHDPFSCMTKCQNSSRDDRKYLGRKSL